MKSSEIQGGNRGSDRHGVSQQEALAILARTRMVFRLFAVHCAEFKHRRQFFS
jgi:hypothetical protein